MDQIIKLISLDGYQIKTAWSDGKTRINDVQEYFKKWKDYKNLSAYLNKAVFDQVTFKQGSLTLKSIKILEDEPGLEDNYFNISPKML